MKTNLQEQLLGRKQKMLERIDRFSSFTDCHILGSRVKYELSEKQQAIACGGLGTIVQLVKQLDLRPVLNRGAAVFKFYMPYDETDHILNIALNLMTGGTCLEHLENRRTDEAYLNALGVRRIPDPTTAGDFCRRFDQWKRH